MKLNENAVTCNICYCLYSIFMYTMGNIWYLKEFIHVQYRWYSISNTISTYSNIYPAMYDEICLTDSVMSIFSTAVVLKDGKPRSRAWTTTDHLQSFRLVMFCTISIDLMNGFSLISPVDVLMSKMLSGSAFIMEYSMRLLGSSASSSTA